MEKSEFKRWANIVAGCFILSVGYVLFINPYTIVPGGTYGASIVLHSLFPMIQVGTFSYMIDIPLLVLSVLILGKSLGARTLVAVLLSPAFMNLISWLVYPTPEALHALDPAQICGGSLNLSNHLFLSVIIGSVIIGVGCGTVVRNGATTGGSDIIGLIIMKFTQIRFSRAIVIVDVIVVLAGIVATSLGGKSSTESITLALYSIISIWIIARAIARTINGAADNKIMFIISSGDLEPLRKFILEDLDRTATCIKSSGLYTQQEKQMFFLVVSYREVHRIKQQVKNADPTAFVVVTDAYDTYGDGWKTLPDFDELQPE